MSTSIRQISTVILNGISTREAKILISNEYFCRINNIKFTIFTDRVSSLPFKVRKCAVKIPYHELNKVSADYFTRRDNVSLANIFKYKLISEYGGLFIDSDILILRDPFEYIVHNKINLQKTKYGCSNKVIYSPVENKLFNSLCDYIKHNRSPRFNGEGNLSGSRVLSLFIDFGRHFNSVVKLSKLFNSVNCFDNELNVKSYYQLRAENEYVYFLRDKMNFNKPLTEGLSNKRLGKFKSISEDHTKCNHIGMYEQISEGLVHEEVKNKWYSKLGNILFIHDNNTNSSEDAELLFENIHTPIEFLGKAIYLENKVGGNLRIAGKEVKPLDLNTSNFKLKPTDTVMYDNKILTIKDLLNKVRY